MKTEIRIIVATLIAVAALALCGCKPKPIEWQYEKIELRYDRVKEFASGRKVIYRVHIQYRDLRTGEELDKDSEKLFTVHEENTIEDVFNLIGQSGWELASAAPDQTQFFFKRPHADYGTFFMEEEFETKK